MAPSGGPLSRDFRRTTLRARHRPVVRALAEALLSPDGEVTPERLDDLVDEVDRFVSPASSTLRFGLVAMLAILRWSPLLFGRLRTFETLGCEERVRHLERLERSRVAQLPLVVVAYKTMLTMLFYEDAAELRALGYPGEHARERWKRGLSIVAGPDGPGALATARGTSPPESD